MSEGRRGINTVAIAALFLAVAAGVAAGYVYQRQDKGLGNLASQVRQINNRQKAATQARRSLGQVHDRSFGSLTQGLRGLWTAVRGIQNDIRKLDDRLGKIEDKSGGGPGASDLRKRLQTLSARTVLLQARVEALERRAGSRSKTVVVPGNGGSNGSATGDRKADRKDGRQSAAAGKAKQPPFWSGCIDSLNKSARLSTSAERVCDCIVGRIRDSGKVSAKDRDKILGQRQFTTRVRGVSAGSQKVLEQAVVQCALRQFKQKKKK